MAPIEPRALAHYLAACSAAHISPADISSTFRSALDARELMATISALSIPDAVRYLRAKFTHANKVKV